MLFVLILFSNRAKNINVDTGVIVFDDIKDCDVNVTYDLIDGEFPPPNISGKAFKMIIKVHIFWEGHKILRNLSLTFDWHYIGQK